MAPDNQSSQSQDDALQNVSNPLKVMQPGERVLCEIRRHPIGLLGIYGTFLLVVLAAVAVLVGARYIAPDLTAQDRLLLGLGVGIFCVLMGLFTYVGASVYKGNRWIVTTDSITQVAQITLFNRQISQLSLANLEDVTVQQNGIAQTLFGYGNLRAESAGQRGKFVFRYCPRPTEFGRQLIAAHEAYIAEHPEEMRTTNRPLANTTSFNQSYDPTQPPRM